MLSYLIPVGIDPGNRSKQTYNVPLELFYYTVALLRA